MNDCPYCGGAIPLGWREKVDPMRWRRILEAFRLAHMTCYERATGCYYACLTFVVD